MRTKNETPQMLELNVKFEQTRIYYPIMFMLGSIMLLLAPILSEMFWFYWLNAVNSLFLL